MTTTHLHELLNRHKQVLHHYRLLKKMLDKNWDRDFRPNARSTDKNLKVWERRRRMVVATEALADLVNHIRNTQSLRYAENIFGKKLVKAAHQERELWRGRDSKHERRVYWEAVMALDIAATERLRDCGLLGVDEGIDHSIAWGNPDEGIV